MERDGHNAGAKTEKQRQDGEKTRVTELTWIAKALVVGAVALSMSTTVLPANAWAAGYLTKRAPPTSQCVANALASYTPAMAHALHIASPPCETWITHAIAAVHGNLCAVCANIFARMAHPSLDAICTARRAVTGVARS